MGPGASAQLSLPRQSDNFRFARRVVWSPPRDVTEIRERRWSLTAREGIDMQFVAGDADKESENDWAAEAFDLSACLG